LLMRGLESLRAEVESRLGFMPAYLGICADRPDVLEGLWQQTRWGYLENPLPALLKEQLLAYLARYCGSAYCLVAHACELHRLGWKGSQILELLRSAPPPAAELAEHARLLQQAPDGQALTSAGLQRTIVWLAAELFLQRDRRGFSQEVLQGQLGLRHYDDLLALLSYARTLHLWAEAHPQLTAGRDPRADRLELLVAEEPALPGFFECYGRHIQHEQQTRERQLLAELGRRDWATRALEASEQRHRLAVLHAPFPVMIYAEDLQVVEINDVWTELSGWALGDIPTLDAWFEKAQPGLEAPSRDEIDALYSSEQRVEEGAQQIRTRYGGELAWDFTSAPLGPLPDGRRAVIRMAVDVTERRQLEATLWDTNRRMLRILESITDGFFSLDADWRLIYVNQRAVELMNRERNALIGQCIFDVFPQAREWGLQQKAAGVMESGTTISHEVFLSSAQRWIEYHIYPADEGLSVYFQDITEHRRAEQAVQEAHHALNQILKSSPHGIVVIDLEGRVKLWNPAAERMFGWTEQEVLGQVLPLMPADRAEQFMQGRQALLDGRERLDLSGPCLKKDGSLVMALFSIGPVYDGQGLIRSLMGSLTPMNGNGGRGGA
jgi:PAS domain S-box-containing protein